MSQRIEVVTAQDYRENERKRKRRSARPCDTCRKRKTRCLTRDGDDNCVHCQLRGTACTFQHDAPDRVSRSGTRASKDPGDDSVAESASTTAEPRAFPSFQSPAKTSTSVGSDATAPAAAMGIEPPVADSIVEDATLGADASRFAELYGLGSDMEPILMKYRPYDQITHEFSLETHSIRRVGDNDNQGYPLTFHMASDEKAVDDDSTHAQVDAIEGIVRPHGPRLLELFWRHVQPCYPILAKDVFVHEYNQSYRLISAPLLGAVYLSAVRWWSYDPELSIQQPPDTAHLRKAVQTAILSSYHRPRLSSIQAVLLLLQCQPEDPLNPDHTFAWGLTCQALAIGQCLGLHLDASDWSVPRWERNLRKRLSWALYMQDRWTALAYGRPVHIHDDDWIVPETSHLDFTDYDANPVQSDTERRSIAATGKLEFMLMASLTKILSVVLSTFYTAKASREQDTVVLFDKAKPLLNALSAWYQDIPDSLQMNVTYQRKLCFHGYLHFSYYGVVMTILRRLVRSTAVLPRCSDESVLSEIRQTALQTAQDAINFVTNLRPDHLEAFWYFTSPYLFSLMGSFTTLLLVTSLSSQERNFWQESLNSYLWRLRMMSKSCEPMQYAVNRLEGAILRGLEHALAVNLNEPIDEDVSPQMVNLATDYTFTDFGDWDLAADEYGAFDLLSAMALHPDSLLPGQGG